MEFNKNSKSNTMMAVGAKMKAGSNKKVYDNILKEKIKQIVEKYKTIHPNTLDVLIRKLKR